jgi:hypothetical protein
MKVNPTYFLLLIFLFSCSNVNSEKQKSSEPKEKEQPVREQELKLKQQENQDVQNKQATVAPASSDTGNIELSAIENLIGYWLVPHSATVNIRFNRDKKFVFHDYNLTLDKNETLTGTFELNDRTLTLLYDDRPKQKFRFYKGEEGDDNYYIKSKGYYFVKG